MADIKAVIDLTAVRVPGDFLPRHIKLTSKSPSILVGRSSSKHKAERGSPAVTNAFFDCPVVSRKHAELLLQGKELQIKDLSSLHGTSINGKRIHTIENLKSGDVISIGNSIADGTQSFHATVFKIDYQIVETVPRAVVDLSSPATSPVLSASQTCKPVVSTARVVWDEIEISPSPVVKQTTSQKPTVMARENTYTVPDEESDFDDDDILDVVERSQPSRHDAAAVHKNLQSSITEAELGEVADDLMLDDESSSLQGSAHDEDQSVDRRDPTKKSSALQDAVESDVEDDQESDFNSSDDSSMSDSYGSESPPSSELESSPIVAATKPSTSAAEPTTTPQQATKPAPKQASSRGEPNANTRNEALADFDFNAFLDPAPPAQAHFDNIPGARDQYPAFYPTQNPTGYPSSLPIPAPPPPKPFETRAFISQHQNEPHPFYPVNGVSSGLEPRGPWSRPPSFQTNNSTDHNLYSVIKGRCPGPLDEEALKQAQAKMEKQHAALLDRVAISSIVSKPDIVQAKDARGTKRSANAMEDPIGTQIESAEVAAPPVHVEAGQTEDNESMEPALKKLRLADGVAPVKSKKSSSKAKTAGTFALGAVAGGVALMGALIALPDSVFF